MTQFMADPSGNLAKAQGYYAKLENAQVLELLTNARGPFHLGRALFCCSLHQ